MGTPHIGMGRDMSIFQIGESPYQYGVHSNLRTNTYTLKGKDGSSIDFMALTMIDPASSWLEVVELPTITQVTTKKVNGKERTIEEEIFDILSDQIARLVNKIWLCRYPRCRYLIYDNGSEFKLHFETLCDSYGIKRKPTTIKNPQANAICECIHQVLGTMMCTSEL